MESSWIKYGEKWKDISQSKQNYKEKWVKNEITAENIHRLKESFKQGKKLNGKK